MKATYLPSINFMVIDLAVKGYAGLLVEDLPGYRRIDSLSGSITSSWKITAYKSVSEVFAGSKTAAQMAEFLEPPNETHHYTFYQKYSPTMERLRFVVDNARNINVSDVNFCLVSIDKSQNVAFKAQIFTVN